MQKFGKGGRENPRVPRAPERIHELEKIVSSAQDVHHLYGWIVQGRKGGRYRILDKLDEGGMGTIFKAVCMEGSEAGRIVAIKFISEHMVANTQMLERFMRETKALSRINHSNVVRIIDSGEAYERSICKPFMIMEYIEGEDLESVIRRMKYLTWETCRPLLMGIASGLAAAHKLGIIHRDLKPANIRVDNTMSGRPVILDFGISKDTSSDEKLTVTGITMGTPNYMSPEQAHGSKDIDARSDIYSFCALAYHLVTGTPLFPDDNPLDVAMKQIKEDPPPPRQRRKGLELPSEIGEAIMKGLRKDPADRFQGMEELLDLIQKSSESRHPFLSPEVFDKKGFMAPKPKYRVRVLMGVVLSGMAALGAAFSYAYLRAGKVEQDHILPAMDAGYRKSDVRVRMKPPDAHVVSDAGTNDARLAIHEIGLPEMGNIDNGVSDLEGTPPGSIFRSKHIRIPK